jgi:hypothetical protein
VVGKGLIGALVVVLLMGVSGCGGGGTAGTLIGSVGPGFTIVLKDPSGHVLTTVKAGRYSVTVTDRSAFLNFHLFGPGVNEATSITGTGTSRWSVDLKPGTYQYQCDAHVSLVHGSFRVT